MTINFSNKEESGQALLIVLLAMAALTTVVLSVVSKSVSEVSVTTNEEESLRAFSAAEAGVEKALVTDTTGTISNNLTVPSAGGGPSTVSQYSADIGRYPDNPRAYAYPFELLSGQTAAVWMVDSKLVPGIDCSGGGCFTGTQLNFCWGTPGTPSGSATTPAISVSVIYKDLSGNLASASTGFDPYSTRALAGAGGAPANKFQTAGTCGAPIAGKSFAFGATLDMGPGGLGISGQPVLARVKMLYNGVATAHSFGVTTTSDLPTQGRKVSSEGTSGSSTRKIEAYLLNPELPYIFDAALYSPNDIAK